jgi:PleD family two-component response regulator
MFAERIGRELQRLGAERSTALSTSAGVAALSASEPDPAALLLVADRALYAAKQAGRRRVAAWEHGATRVESRLDQSHDDQGRDLLAQVS